MKLILQDEFQESAAKGSSSVSSCLDKLAAGYQLRDEKLSSREDYKVSDYKTSESYILILLSSAASSGVQFSLVLYDNQ